jgi:hypothetical protein
MSSIENIQTPSSGKAWFITGAVSLVLGVAAIIALIVIGSSTPVEQEGDTTGQMQGLTIVAAAVFTGLGLLLIAVGALKRRRARVERGD